LQAAQDVTIGGRLSKTQYQIHPSDADAGELNRWGTALSGQDQDFPALPMSPPISSCRADARYHHQARSRSSFGILPPPSTHTLDDAFGQRIVSTMFTEINQRPCVMEVDPKFQYGPEALNGIYVRSSSGQQVPLSPW